MHLRDGDCVHADIGPWGPPPPTPARSASFSTLRPASLTIALLWTLSGLPGGFLLGVYAMWEAKGTWESLQLGSYPWRQDPSRATLRQVGGPVPCRCLYLCPWTGRHASVQSTADTSVERIQVELGQHMVGQAPLQPVWPSLRRNCLAFVPRVFTSDLSCVVGLRAGTAHPLVLPRCISPAELQLVCQHHLGRTIGPVRLPPALKARQLVNPTEPLHLRDGDVLDVVDENHPSAIADVPKEEILKDHVLWSRDFRIVSCITVRLWFPHVRMPVLTWLKDGEHWDSDTLTFRPYFSSRYDGRWVPVQWAPGRIPHLVQASSVAESVATLVDARDGVRGLRLIPRITGLALADALHTEASEAHVLGLAQCSPHEQLQVRDGDVIWDSLMYGEQERWWLSIEDEVSGSCLACLFAGLMHRKVFFVFLLSLSRISGVMAMRRFSSSDRSRSRSPSPLSSGPWIGRWSPDSAAPFAQVTNQGHIDYRVLCPFRGWSPYYYVRPASSADELSLTVADFTGPWADSCTLIGATHPRLPLVALPTMDRGLATCILTSGVHTKAFLHPAIASYQALKTFCLRTLGVSDMQLSCHPAIRPYALQASFCFTLRHGDTFDVYPAESQHDYRATPRATFKHLGDLHHHHAWHQEFRVLYGGRVKVWQHDDDYEYSCTQRRVVDGSIWTPVLGRFRAPSTIPGGTSWVPTHNVEDGWCHFVQASESGRVGVLLHDSDQPTRCVSLPVRYGEGRAPNGWRIQSRIVQPGLRDGDVLVPTTSAARSSRPLAMLAALFCRSHLCYLSCAFAAFSEASSMVLPPVDRSLAVPAAVGRYPWRVPRPLRVFHQAGGPDISGQLISPYAEPSGFLSLPEELSVDEAYVTLSGAEPAWFHDLVPVWPSQGHQCITFVPVPPCRELVCVLLISTEWQQAVLLPSRVDLGWVSGHIRRALRGSVIAVRGPVQAVRPDRSLNDAVDWRNGDVLLAWEWHASDAAMEHPVLPTVELVRHAALWMADFEVSSSISVVLWRPGHRPLITALPLPIRWSAAACTFVGQFARRYPGWLLGSRPVGTLATAEHSLASRFSASVSSRQR